MACKTPLVVTRADPLAWAVLIVALTYSLVGDVQTLQANGWLDPEAFFRENVTVGRNNPYYTVEWFGHAMMAVSAVVFVSLVIEFALLAAAGFKALTFDGRCLREHGVFRRVQIESTAITMARRIRSTAGVSDWIEIRYRKPNGREDSMLIMPWFHRESVDTIATNLAACGIPVAPRSAD